MATIIDELRALLWSTIDVLADANDSSELGALSAMLEEVALEAATQAFDAEVRKDH